MAESTEVFFPFASSLIATGGLGMLVMYWYW